MPEVAASRATLGQFLNTKNAGFAISYETFLKYFISKDSGFVHPGI